MQIFEEATCVWHQKLDVMNAGGGPGSNKLYHQALQAAAELQLKMGLGVSAVTQQVRNPTQYL